MSAHPWLGRLPGVIGMNHRNRHLVAEMNERKWIAVANDKVRCKVQLEEHGVATPQTLGVIRNARHVEEVCRYLEQSRRPFVVKPARSARGRGVLLCQRVQDQRIHLGDDASMSLPDFTFYALRILHGEFSNGLPLDAALVEERIALDKSWMFDDLPGAVDLRVIVKSGVAIMAMARVPTRLSGGRANLHAGGVGVGIDLDRGVTTGGVWKERPATRHPDTGQCLAGQQVEGMMDCIRLAERCHRAVPLGYMGVDIMWDVARGPMVIELNARPGLAVQIANHRGLLDALSKRTQSIHEQTHHSLAPDRSAGDRPDLPWPHPETVAGTPLE